MQYGNIAAFFTSDNQPFPVIMFSRFIIKLDRFTIAFIGVFMGIDNQVYKRVHDFSFLCSLKNLVLT
jgi:hypothetical protein